MERKGYIARQSVAQDARLKQLVLTEKGRQFHENTMLAQMCIRDSFQTARNAVFMPAIPRSTVKPSFSSQPVRVSNA